MARQDHAGRRLPGDDETSSCPGEPAGPGSLVPADTGAAYSRFSLALIRQPPEVPYTGSQVPAQPEDVVPFLHQLLEREPYECLGALLLTARGHPIGHTIPFRGTITSCQVESLTWFVTSEHRPSSELLLQWARFSNSEWL